VIATPVTGTDTVILKVSVKPPSWVVTVIVAVPALLAMARPLVGLIETMFVALEDQVTTLFVASVGDTVAVSDWVSFMFIVGFAAFITTSSTAMLVSVTVTAQVSVFAPSAVVTVMVAVPLPTALTDAVADPFAATVATEVLLDDQVMALFVAVEGLIDAVIVCAVP
jgi:hypothetical protein